MMTNTLTLNRNNLFLLLLFLLPVMNFISNRLSPLLNFAIILMIFYFIFILNPHRYKYHTSYSIKFFIIIHIIILTLAVAYKLLVYQFVDIYTISTFYFTYVVLLGFILLSTNVDMIVNKHFLSIVNFILILSCIAIVIGHIVMHTTLPDDWQLIYRYEAGAEYFTRPFGLFGQPSINTGVILFTYLIRLYLVQEEKTKESLLSAFFYFTIVTISIYYQRSGTGYIGYLILIAILSARNKLLFLSTIALMAFSISNLYFLYLEEISSFSNRLSVTYFLNTYDYFYNRIIIPYVSDITIFDFLFGVNDQRHIPIDFGPIYILAYVGFLYLVTFTGFILYIIYKAKNRYITYAFILLFILSLHYPIVIYPVPSMLYFLILIYLENKQQRVIE